MRNQLVAGLFCCLTAQATAFTIWANYTSDNPNPLGYASALLMWYSWLLRAEYVEYTQNVYAGLDYVTIRDVRQHTCWEDPHATNYYQRVASAMLMHWSAIPYLGYKPELPECLQ